MRGKHKAFIRYFPVIFSLLVSFTVTLVPNALFFPLLMHYLPCGVFVFDVFAALIVEISNSAIFC
jgi:hypothetical protein